MHICWLALTIVFGLATISQAAQMERLVPSDDGIEFIAMNGAIEIGDDEEFRRLTTPMGRVVVLLNSEGGAVVPALQIGNIIHDRGYATAVKEETLCASACALIWLAGSPRFSSSSSQIGFHASYVMKNGSATESGVANALIGAYLNELGLSNDAVVFITSAPPEGMEWLSREEATRTGIEISPLEPEHQNSSTDDDRFDPLGTVAKFYNALSLADGEAASALIIPEKRGIGPFDLPLSFSSI